MSDLMIHNVAVSNSAQAFIGAMIEADHWNLTNVREFLEKPWHWEREYRAWLTEGSPSDATHLRFERFVAVLEQE